jgi:hypothetical protein
MTRTVRFLRYAVLGETARPPRRSPRRRRGPARNWKYKAWIRSLPSAVSGAGPCEAAHTGTDGGMSQKASDYSCVPLTAAEHRQYHQLGRGGFEARYGVNCRDLVARLNHCWFAYAGEVK